MPQCCFARRQPTSTHGVNSACQLGTESPTKPMNSSVSSRSTAHEPETAIAPDGHHPVDHLVALLRSEHRREVAHDFGITIESRVGRPVTVAPFAQQQRWVVSRGVGHSLGHGVEHLAGCVHRHARHDLDTTIAVEHERQPSPPSAFLSRPINVISR